MDLRNFCQKIDVENIKSKFSQLPRLPTLRLPKLKSRKIFGNEKKTSREDIGGNVDDRQPRKSMLLTLQPAEFINHTPTRITTISSLVFDAEQRPAPASAATAGYNCTYRSAGHVDDDFHFPPVAAPTRPMRRSAFAEQQRPPPNVAESQQSPIFRLPPPPAEAAVPPLTSTAPAQNTFILRLQKSYKDLSEFRLKHLFVKETLVRRDNINVDNYVQQYAEDRRRRQSHDDNSSHNFSFMLSRQSTFHSSNDGDLADDSSTAGGTHAPRAKKQPQSQPVPVPGPVPPRRRNLHEESDESGMEATPPKRGQARPTRGIAATRFARVRQPPLSMPMTLDTDAEADDYRERIDRLRGYISSTERPKQASAAETETELPPVVHKLLARLPASSKLKEPPAIGQLMRENFKRLQKSLKNRETSAADDERDESKSMSARRARLTARLRNFRAAENEVALAAANAANVAVGAGGMSSFASKMQANWKKTAASNDEEPSNATAAAAATATNLMGKLRYIRARSKLHSGGRTYTDDVIEDDDDADDSDADCCGDDDDDDDDDGDADKSKASGRKATAKSGRRRRLINDFRQRTVKKMNERMQQMQQQLRIFQQRDQQQEQREESTNQTTATTAESVYYDGRKVKLQTGSTAMPPPLPLTAPPPVPPVARHMMPTNDERSSDEGDSLSATMHVTALDAAWTAKPILCDDSLDDGDDDDSDVDFTAADAGATIASCLPRVLIHQDYSDGHESTLIIAVKRPATLSPRVTRISELIEPESERISKSLTPEQPEGPRLQKKPTLALAPAPFEDFDDELCGEPIFHVSGSFERESSEDPDADAADDDNSSRVTKIRVPVVLPEPDNQCRQPTSMAAENVDEDRPPSLAPSPPPAVVDEVPPPLPISRPPLPLADDTPTTMARVAKPLVKTASLRLTYSEQVNPDDVGKVNKLISRFEQPPAPAMRARRPRLVARRRSESSSSEDDTDDEHDEHADDDDDDSEDIDEPGIKYEKQPAIVTLQRSSIHESAQLAPAHEHRIRLAQIPEIITTRSDDSNKNNNNNNNNNHHTTILTNLDRQNSNCSRSEYGSPLTYPSSLRSSNETTPTPTPIAQRRTIDVYHSPAPAPASVSVPTTLSSPQPKQIQREPSSSSRRCILMKDDDKFYSFDSDEDNSYYSISPSGSSRYIVEI